jgi:hypothetical protein
MKFMVSVLLFTAVLAIPRCAGGAVERRSQDLKLPTQAVLEKQTVTAPIAVAATRVLNAHAGVTATSPVTVTTFAAQPDVPRNLTVTPAGTTADVTACTVAVSGTDFYSKPISENFAITNTQSTATVGALAFKSVTSVAIPAACESGATHAATWNVGVGSKLGLNHCMAGADHFFHAGLGGVKEATAPTVAADATTVSRNTASLSSSLTGSANVTLFYVQNFRCHGG